MAAVSNWMHVDFFTVDQAAALWCDMDPSTINAIVSWNPPEVLAAKQMLFSGIISGELMSDSSPNVFHVIGDYSTSLVHRINLEKFARVRGIYPAFLFDTLAPIKETQTNKMTAITAPIALPSPIVEKPDANRGGRPVQYDWDSFTMEIISKANRPDGLPETQAELVRQMLDWFSNTYGSEPAESSVKSRISKIYNYLQKAKNPID